MAELLVEWNVPYVFGLGGSEEVGFLDVLVDRLALQYVHGIHEASVMSMADGYARATEDVPIMNLHSVAGAAYALGPMVNAFKDRIPVVVTVGRQSTDMRGTNAFLESVNLHQLPQEYTQWTWDVMNAKTIPEVVRRIADMLVEAEFPVIAVGKEGARFDPSEPLMELAELLGAPVFQDIYMAHGPMVFPSTHPHYAGMFRQEPSYPTDIDLYWALGGTMFGFGKLPSEPIVPRTAKVIHSGLDSAEVSRTYLADLAVIAGVKATLAAVLDELRRRAPSTRSAEARRRRSQAARRGVPRRNARTPRRCRGDSLGSKSHYQRTLDGRAESTHCPRRDRRERAHHVRAVRSLLLGHRSIPAPSGDGILRPAAVFSVGACPPQ